MTQPPPYGNWNVPAPPPMGRPHERIRGRRVAAGIGAALLGHGVTILGMLIGLAVDNAEYGISGVLVLLVGQVILFLGCLVVGVVLVARGEPGFGVGLLIGWAVGLLIAPFAGFGLCLWLISGSGG